MIAPCGLGILQFTWYCFLSRRTLEMSLAMGPLMKSGFQKWENRKVTKTFYFGSVVRDILSIDINYLIN